jgi:hypothetical protein
MPKGASAGEGSLNFTPRALGSRSLCGSRWFERPDRERETMIVTLNSSSLAEMFLALNVGDQVKGP